MIITVTVRCADCDHPVQIVVPADEQWWEFECGACGKQNQGLRSIDWTTTTSISLRAKTYRQQGDFVTSIVFSAMVIEAELARLYFKWRRQDHKWALIAQGRALEWEELPYEALEADYRGLGNFFNKLRAVCDLLVGSDIDAFVRGRPDDVTRITAEFPNLTIGSLGDGIHAAVLDKRNRVVHTAYLGHKDEDALLAERVADLTVGLLRAMDLERRS